MENLDNQDADGRKKAGSYRGFYILHPTEKSIHSVQARLWSAGDLNLQLNLIIYEKVFLFIDRNSCDGNDGLPEE